MNQYKKLGYLHNSFEIFHIIDTDKKNFEYHYHDFYKLLIFLDGSVTYHIEGKSYNLEKNNIILVNPGEIHKPYIRNNEVYNRIIVYISKNLFDIYKKKGFDLEYCFRNAIKEKSNLISNINSKLQHEINELTMSYNENSSLTILYRQTIFFKILIILNDLIKNNSLTCSLSYTSNSKIIEIISYINENLTSKITIEELASKFFINKSYLMHLFKKETGYTIINYITEKRLFKAKKLITQGIPLTEASFQSGFNDYSNFYKSFKKKFNCSPKELL